MGGLLLTAEVVVGCLLLFAVFLGVTYWRRRTILRDGEVTLCAFRAESSRWRTGLLRLGDVSLDWFPLFGVTARPHFRWARVTLDLGVGRQSEEAEATHPLIGTTLHLTFTAVEERLGPMTAELAVAPERYTAVRAWAEAAPPGTRPVG